MDGKAMTELDELLGRLCDGALTDEESARLRELLREDQAQERYAEYMLLHEGLRREQGGTALTAPTWLPPVTTPTPRRKRRYGLAGAVVALAAAAVLLMIFWPRAGAERQGIAVLTRTAGARWQGPVDVGTPLFPGRLVLEAGLAQLDLYSGATLVLEGPAALELVNEKTARLEYGRVRSRVPEPAKGLRLTLPGGDVVDLGTEFAVDQPRQGSAQIHVFDGEVEWRRDGRVTRLTEGQALELQRDADRPMAADQRSFADPGRLTSEAAADAQRRWQAWSRQRQRLIGDPALLMYFDFQDAGPWGRSARNHAAGPDGAIVGGRWVPGRFPEKQALEFKRPSDRVLVQVPGQHRSFSIAAWVRFDGLDNEYNAFVHTDGWGPGGVHTHIQPNGTIALHLHGRERLSSQRRIGRTDLGRWVHLAWVWDTEARRTALYMDGQLDAEMPIRSGDAPVTIGSAQIGNWDKEHRNLNGQVDEVVILGRALRVDEIAALASPSL